ncbi:hypothetical protein GCM10017782_01330 [Deinococcus ficus]|nr:hypothetical protein GCM10017782_01330 [Deinococcus ficus]
MHPAAHLRGRLQHLHALTGAVKGPGGGEAGQTGSDNHDILHAPRLAGPAPRGLARPFAFRPARQQWKRGLPAAQGAARGQAGEVESLDYQKLPRRK